jgi:hypothetical protein
MLNLTLIRNILHGLLKIKDFFPLDVLVLSKGAQRLFGLSEDSKFSPMRRRFPPCLPNEMFTPLNACPMKCGAYFIGAKPVYLG